MLHGGGVDDGDIPCWITGQLMPHEIDSHGSVAVLEKGERTLEEIAMHDWHHELDEIGIAVEQASVFQRDPVSPIAVARQRRLSQLEVVFPDDIDEVQCGLAGGADVIIHEPEIIESVDQLGIVLEQVINA